LGGLAQISFPFREIHDVAQASLVLCNRSNHGWCVHQSIASLLYDLCDLILSSAWVPLAGIFWGVFSIFVTCLEDNRDFGHGVVFGCNILLIFLGLANVQSIAHPCCPICVNHILPTGLNPVCRALVCLQEIRLHNSDVVALPVSNTRHVRDAATMHVRFDANVEWKGSEQCQVASKAGKTRKLSRIISQDTCAGKT